MIYLLGHIAYSYLTVVSVEHVKMKGRWAVYELRMYHVNHLIQD